MRSGSGSGPGSGSVSEPELVWKCARERAKIYHPE